MADQITTLELCLAQADSNKVALADQLDDAVNRSKCDNIFILNLKKGTVGDHLLEFFDSLIL